MIEVTNHQRAEWARTAVEAFRDTCRGTPLNVEGGYDEAIRDLIVDLLHLARIECDLPGDLDGMLNTCLVNHNEEIAEEEFIPNR